MPLDGSAIVPVLNITVSSPLFLRWRVLCNLKRGSGHDRSIWVFLTTHVQLHSPRVENALDAPCLLLQKVYRALQPLAGGDGCNIWLVLLVNWPLKKDEAIPIVAYFCSFSRTIFVLDREECKWFDANYLVREIFQIWRFVSRLRIYTKFV